MLLFLILAVCKVLTFKLRYFRNSATQHLWHVRNMTCSKNFSLQVHAWLILWEIISWTSYNYPQIAFWFLLCFWTYLIQNSLNFLQITFLGWFFWKVVLIWLISFCENLMNHLPNLLYFAWLSVLLVIKRSIQFGLLGF